jgi:hypothetical protein
MSPVEAVLGAVVLGVIVITVIGLVTGRLDRRAESCCPRDPARDLRMRAAAEPAKTPDSPTRR